MTELFLWNVVEAVQDASDADTEVVATLVDLLLTDATPADVVRSTESPRVGRTLEPRQEAS